MVYTRRMMKQKASPELNREALRIVANQTMRQVMTDPQSTLKNKKQSMEMNRMINPGNPHIRHYPIIKRLARDQLRQRKTFKSAVTSGNVQSVRAHLTPNVPYALKSPRTLQFRLKNAMKAKIGPIKKRKTVATLLDGGAVASRPALIQAIETGQASLVLDLLRKGAPADITFMNGKTLLLRAIVENRSTQIIGLLLEYGANPNYQGYDGLMSAIHQNRSNVVELLLLYGATVKPLHLSHARGSQRLVKLLKTVQPDPTLIREARAKRRSTRI